MKGVDGFNGWIDDRQINISFPSFLFSVLIPFTMMKSTAQAFQKKGRKLQMLQIICPQLYSGTLGWDGRGDAWVPCAHLLTFTPVTGEGIWPRLHQILSQSPENCTHKGSRVWVSREMSEEIRDPEDFRSLAPGLTATPIGLLRCLPYSFIHPLVEQLLSALLGRLTQMGDTNPICKC